MPSLLCGCVKRELFYLEVRRTRRMGSGQSVLTSNYEALSAEEIGAYADEICGTDSYKVLFVKHEINGRKLTDHPNFSSLLIDIGISSEADRQILCDKLNPDDELLAEKMNELPIPIGEIQPQSSWHDRNRDDRPLLSNNNDSEILSEDLILPPILLISFNDFKTTGEFPRNPECKEMTVTLNSIDNANSFVVFISHCWLRGWCGAEGYDGRPHPDSKIHEKYALCVNGIERLWRYLAPGMIKCYVWCDFACINQSQNPALELKQLDKIVSMADCMFTPIVDDSEWAYRASSNGPYVDYKAYAWNDGNFAYLNRGWCRTEMLYAANIPLSDQARQKSSHFCHGLKVSYENGRRPHYLFGTREDRLIINPLQLPPLQNSFFLNFHPANGHLSVASDRDKIEDLVKLLEPYIKVISSRYTGDTVVIATEGAETNEKSSIEHETKVRHGRGRMIFENGEVYEGEWVDDTRSGDGMHTYADGGVYTGRWQEGKKHGTGRYDFADGSYYEGEWEADLRSGVGCIAYADGGRYDGEWKGNQKHGQGKYVYLYGGIYEGCWEGNKHHGWGKFHLPTDPSFHVLEQQQKTLFRTGDTYEGEWQDNLVHGKGTLTRYDGGTVVSGSVFECGHISSTTH